MDLLRRLNRGAGADLRHRHPRPGGGRADRPHRAHARRPRRGAGLAPGRSCWPGTSDVRTMDTFFGLPTGGIALGAVAAVLAVLAVLAVRAWRWPVFLRLGLRQLPRRPAQTVLIVAGLMLSTALVTASLTTGDTITRAIRGAAVRRAGPAGRGGHLLPDRPPRRAGRDPFSGTIFFPADVAGRLASDCADDPALRQDVEGVDPGHLARLHRARPHQPADGAGLAARPAPGLPARLRRPGRRRRAAPLARRRSTPGEVIVTGAARGALAVQEGDDLSCTVLGVPLRWRVAAIAGERGARGRARRSPSTSPWPTWRRARLWAHGGPGGGHQPDLDRQPGRRHLQRRPQRSGGGGPPARRWSTRPRWARCAGCWPALSCARRSPRGGAISPSGRSATLAELLAEVDRRGAAAGGHASTGCCAARRCATP